MQWPAQLRAPAPRYYDEGSLKYEVPTGEVSAGRAIRKVHRETRLTLLSASTNVTPRAG